VDRLLPEDAKYLCIFDRGYAGIRIMDQIIENHQKFLIRLPSNSFKREQDQLSLENPDQWMDVIYDNARTNLYCKDYEFRQKLLTTTYHLRFVRVYFKDQKGNEEYNTFITNLFEEEFDTSAIAELYHIRWDIETSYRALKSQLRVEEFSGNRDVLIRQDIYAGAIVYNAVSMSIAENKKYQSAPHERYKYDMQINRNYAIGILKTDLLKMFVLYRDKKAIKRAQAQFEKNIVKHSCPVRRERSNLRITKGNGKNNHSYRRSY
jgi:CRISPR/Cas system-associated protein endoribonuclease Cas2